MFWCLKVVFGPMRIELRSLKINFASLIVKVNPVGLDFGPSPRDFGHVKSNFRVRELSFGRLSLFEI